MLLAIFDTTLRDPDDGIVISQALVDEDGGAEKYAKYGSGWGESIDEEGIRLFIASFSDLSPKAPKEGGVVPLIAQGQADASISTPHHEIGRAACRERACQYVEISVVAVSLNRKLE